VRAKSWRHGYRGARDSVNLGGCCLAPVTNHPLSQLRGHTDSTSATSTHGTTAALDSPVQPSEDEDEDGAGEEPRALGALRCGLERDLISDRVLSGVGRTVALRAVEFVRRIPGTACLTLRLQFKVV